MTPKLVIALALSAGISTAGAVLAYRANNVFVPVAGVGEKVLVGLEDKINSVNEIVVEQGAKKLDLIFKNDAWQVKKSGYPVSPKKVRTVLVGLVNMTKLEAKTSNKDKYLLIDVDAPGKKGGRGRQFSLLNKDGKPVAKIIAGKVLVGKEGPGRDAQYVRLAGEKTSWLALGSILATPELPSWVNPRFLKIDVDSVVSGRIVHLDGEVVSVVRTGADQNGSSTFKLLNVPEGRMPRSSTTIKFVATDLVNLDLLNVRRKKPDIKPVTTAFVEIKGGMKLKFELVEEPNSDGGKPLGWVSFVVTDKGDDPAKARAVSARTQGWEFLLPDYKVASFKKRTEQLLQKQKTAN